MSHMYEYKLPQKKEELYSCSNCTFTFTDRRTMLRHVENHRHGKNFICKICQVGFFREEILSSHLIAVHGTKYSSCCNGNSNLPGNVSLHETSFVPGTSSTLRESVTGSGDVSELQSGSGFSFRYPPKVLYIEGIETLLADDNTPPTPGYLSHLGTLYGTTNLHEYQSPSGPRIAFRQETASGVGEGIGEETTYEVRITLGTETASGPERFSMTPSVHCTPAGRPERKTLPLKHVSPSQELSSNPAGTLSSQSRTPPAEPVRPTPEPVRPSPEAEGLPHSDLCAPSLEPGTSSSELDVSSQERCAPSDTAFNAPKTAYCETEIAYPKIGTQFYRTEPSPTGSSTSSFGSSTIIYGSSTPISESTSSSKSTPSHSESSASWTPSPGYPGSSSDSAQSLDKRRRSSKRKITSKRDTTSRSRKTTRREAPSGRRRSSSGGRQSGHERALGPSTSSAPCLTYEPMKLRSRRSETSYGPGPYSGAGPSSSPMMSSGSESTSPYLEEFYSVVKNIVKRTSKDFERENIAEILELKF